MIVGCINCGNKSSENFYIIISKLRDMYEGCEFESDESKDYLGKITKENEEIDQTENTAFN